MIVYVFKSLDDGWVTVSRHTKPDFCAGLTDEQIKKHYKIVEVEI